MRSSALFIALVLGAAATVSAQPKREAPPKPEENSERVRLDDERGTKTGAATVPPEWVELASPTPARHGTEFVLVGKQAGAFAKLRLDAAKGKTIVRTVKIYFDNGRFKTFQVDTIISERGRKSAFVELGDPQPIDRIVVNTEAHTRGEYAIFGSSGDGTR